jgi:hypothetical protein
LSVSQSRWRTSALILIKKASPSLPVRRFIQEDERGRLPFSSRLGLEVAIEIAI